MDNNEYTKNDDDSICEVLRYLGYDDFVNIHEADPESFSVLDIFKTLFGNKNK